jgi:hypothetical protein
MNKRTWKIITLGLLMFMICAKTVPVYAQQITLTMSPPLIETLIKPGKTILIGYTVQNLGDPTTLEFKIRPFSPQGDLGDMKIEGELISPVRFSLDNTDIQLEKPFFVSQNESKQALVRIRVPEGTPEGDYYFVIMATSHPVPAIGGSSTSLAKATIGSTLLVTVTKNGRLETNGRISLFSMMPDLTLRLLGKEYKIVESSSKVPVNLTVQNLGRNLLKPQGEITLRGPLHTNTTYKLIPQNILATSQRRIAAENPKMPAKSSSLLISGYFVGPYTLSARVLFSENSAQLYATTTFIGVPFKLLIAIGLLMLASIFIIVLVKKRSR